MTFETSKRAIAQIHFGGSRNIAGTGFLVAEGYLLTCAHVVREALFAPADPLGAALEVTFFNTFEPQKATVVFYEFEEQRYGRDVAVLYLPQCLPEDLSEKPTPAPLRALRQYHEAELQVFGYPGDAAGRNLTAVTRGEVSGGWVQIEDTKVPGLAVEAGFSGAPVWCEVEGGIVGMVVARHQGQANEKVGFMIPVQQLQAARQAVERHSLLAVLSPHQQALSSQLNAAYRLCRPVIWPAPLQKDLDPRLADMAQMSVRKLFEFVACLLNQSGIQEIQAELINWFERFKREDMDLPTLIKDMLSQQGEIGSQRMRVFEPRLLVQVQADKTTKGEPYQVNAWVVPDSRRYNPDTQEGYNLATGTGAEPLVAKDWQKYVDTSQPLTLSSDLEAGVSYECIPLLLADYLDQVARREIPLPELTVELFLPLSLVNEAIDQCCIPDDFGFPAPLGSDCHVVLRTQERLEYARGRGLWEAKWNRLQQDPTIAAKDALVDGDRYVGKALQTALKEAIGLRLTERLPQTVNQGEIGLMLATGTPVALWLRSLSSDLADRLHTNILDDYLAQVPGKVCDLRRTTPPLDDEADLSSSPELGHHLSFLWEDFYCVPPTITYSDAKL